MTANLFHIYDKFLALREDGFINTGLEECAYSEERPDGNVRPLVLIQSEHKYNEWLDKLNRWRESVDKLCEGDPVRFKRSAKIFSPEPLLLKDVYRVEVRESTATSQRKQEKSKIVTRQKRLVDAEAINAERTGDYAQYNRYKAQLDTMLADDDEYYLIRTSGYKDVRLLIYMDASSEPIKHSLSYVGAYIMPSKTCSASFLSLPSESQQEKKRSDALDFTNIREIEHSLGIRGRIYSYSDYEKVKRDRKPA
jgi:hypothetical protein